MISDTQREFARLTSKALGPDFEVVPHAGMREELWYFMVTRADGATKYATLTPPNLDNMAQTIKVNAELVVRTFASVPWEQPQKEK